MAAQKPGTEQQIASGNTVIAYHFPCPDGIFAALAAHLHFQQRGHTNVRFAPNRVFAPCTIEELQLQVWLPAYESPLNAALTTLTRDLQSSARR